MDSIRQYIVSVIAAAILCGLVNTLIGKKSAQSAITRLISGLFMALTVISPFINIQAIDFTDYADRLSDNADSVVSYGEIIALDELRSIIKSKTEAYILDKAVSMELDIEVEVTLSSKNPPLPCAVTLKGAVSPYSKEVLSGYIASDLGIPKEDQLWT